MKLDFAFHFVKVTNGKQCSMDWDYDLFGLSEWDVNKTDCALTVGIPFRHRK